MAEQTKPEGPDVGESSEAVNGGPEFQRTPGKAEGEDPADEPQGTLKDPDEENQVDSEHPSS